MTSSKLQILATLANLEQRAPLFFGAIPVADDLVRDLFASSMAALKDSSDFRQATADSREISLLASLTHALLETASLRELLQQRSQAAGHEAGRLISRVATL